MQVVRTEREVRLPPKLWPVFMGEARYRGAYGGRGSAKTRSFATMAAIKGMDYAQQGRSGIILCGREFMNSLDESSMSEVKAAIADYDYLTDFYEVGEKYIRTKDRRVEFKFAGLSRNLDSIKSKSKILLAWIDEAEPVSETAWLKLIPTIREHGSEVWVTWNPERKNSATHKRFREDPPDGAKIVELNYTDNPWFPEVLELERLEDKAKRPDQYAHIWEGDFVTAVDGAYYAQSLTDARLSKRIASVSVDPLMSTYAFWDIGGTGAKSDACAIWIAQRISHDIRVLDYYEAQGQPLAAHLEWLRENNYAKAKCILPHDGVKADMVYSVTYESALKEAQFSVEVVPNQGAGAAMARVRAGRRMFPSITFNEATCEAGLDALGWYHEKIDEERSVGLGPEHDWSSHGADAFGLMCVYFESRKPSTATKKLDYSRINKAVA